VQEQADQMIAALVKTQSEEFKQYKQYLANTIKAKLNSSTDLINLKKIEKEMALQKNYSQAQQAKVLIQNLEEQQKQKAERARHEQIKT
jgi:hypothetical protein